MYVRFAEALLSLSLSLFRNSSFSKNLESLKESPGHRHQRLLAVNQLETRLATSHSPDEAKACIRVLSMNSKTTSDGIAVR